MVNRNTLTGGTGWIQEHPTFQDMEETQIATTYHLIAQNNTPVTVNTSTTSTMTVSVPANSLYKYIEIKAFVRAISTGQNNGGTFTNSSSSLKLYKTYATVNTDLIPTYTFTQTTGAGPSTGDALSNSVNSQTVYYYYEPTSTEIANGFDVSIDLTATFTTAAGVSSTITCDYINIMGI